MTFSTGEVHISEFSILGLHGNKNIRLKLEDNTLILVGENGTHKTTILTLFYNFLAGEINHLTKYSFDTLEMVINSKTFFMQRSRMTIERKVEFDSYFLSREERISGPRRDIIPEREGIELCWATIEDELYAHRFSTKPIEFLFLPTYRRIEKELGIKPAVTNYKPTVRSWSCQESVEFGMKDIEDLWDEKLKQIKQNRDTGIENLEKKFVEDFLSDEYENISQDFLTEISSETLEKVLARIQDEEGLSEERKTQLRQLKNQRNQLVHNVKTDKKILYVFKKRYDFYIELFEHEKSLDDFCNACNRYLHSIEIVYDPTKLDVYIRNRKTSDTSPEQRIELSQLSSGEKQLVSLFTHLYLAEGKQYFLIIDEPEISLSVEWQETFLEDIRNGTFCSGLFVATHSPFMFDNSLRKYAHGVGRFLEVVEPSDDKQ